jgi:hypothetical protein
VRRAVLPAPLQLVRHPTKRRADRYASCAEFAADLHRWQASEHVAARRIGFIGGAWSRLRRFRRQHPTAVALAAGGVITFVALTTAAVAYSSWSVNRFADQVAAITAPENTDPSRRALATALAGMATRLRELGLLPRADGGRIALMITGGVNETAVPIDVNLMKTELRVRGLAAFAGKVRFVGEPGPCQRTPADFLLGLTLQDGSASTDGSKERTDRMQLVLQDALTGGVLWRDHYDVPRRR